MQDRQPLRRELSAMGQVCLRSESKTTPMNIEVILPLEGEPFNLEEITQLLAERFVKDTPRFSCKLINNVFLPMEVDYSYHVEEKNVSNLIEFVNQVVKQPLPTDKPLWKAYLVNEETEFKKSQSLLLIVHHCVADGVSLAYVIHKMTDQYQQSKRSKSKSSLWMNLKSVFYFIQFMIWLIITFPLVLCKWIYYSFAKPRLPELFQVKLNHHRDIYWNQMPMKVQDIKQFTRKLDKNATINDVMVSAFTGALDRYARAVGKPNQKVRLLIAIPVNIRWKPPKVIGNKIGSYLVSIPLGEENPVIRTRTIVRQTRIAKLLPEQYFSFAWGILLSYLPTKWMKKIIANTTGQVSCVVTNVKGFDKPISMFDKQVVRMIGFVPPPTKIPIGFAVGSLAGDLAISLKADTAVIANPELFIQCVTEEIEMMQSFCKSK